MLVLFGLQNNALTFHGKGDDSRPVVAACCKKGGKEPPKTSDDKRSFFATMSTEVIKAMQAALEDETTASECFETAAREWLDKRKKR